MLPNIHLFLCLNYKDKNINFKGGSYDFKKSNKNKKGF